MTSSCRSSWTSADLPVSCSSAAFWRVPVLPEPTCSSRRRASSATRRPDTPTQVFFVQSTVTRLPGVAPSPEATTATGPTGTAEPVGFTRTTAPASGRSLEVTSRAGASSPTAAPRPLIHLPAHPRRPPRSSQPRARSKRSFKRRVATEPVPSMWRTQTQPQRRPCSASVSVSYCSSGRPRSLRVRRAHGRIS